MIDTDKYEGHTEGPWCWDGDILRNYCNDFSHNHDEIDCNVNLEILEVSHANDLEIQLTDADKLLIADAPDLLADNKRLREVMSKVVTILGPYEIDAEELLISALRRVMKNAD